MALNPNYVPLTPLWEVFTDKDILTFLHDGYAKFYIDTQRTVGKPVYQLTGSPPNYTYTQYGFLDTDGSWRVNMNLQGAFDQVIYGYPLDEFGMVQLYFIDFYNSEGVFQFSREGVPNFFAPGGETGTQVYVNYIPNGQFRLHTNLPATQTLEIGEVREPNTPIAFGGWYFKRPIGSTARDFVLFQRIGSYVTNPQKSPRFALQTICQSPNPGDTFKQIAIQFDDVNKFSSDTDEFTFAITMRTVGIPTVSVGLSIIKNFGTGGDSSVQTDITNFNVTTTWTSFFISFTFGANTGKVIGPNNDDYVELVLQIPANELSNVEYDDAVLTPGNVLAPIFVDTTTRQFEYQALFDDTGLPDVNGQSIGLPAILTKTGIRFDDSQVGFIFASGYGLATFGYLAADGATYDSTLYSSDGIPYIRLANKLFYVVNSPLTYLVRTFGTGPGFVTTSIDSLKNITLSTNTPGPVAGATDGANPSGFTFGNIHTGQTGIEAIAYLVNNGFYIRAKNVGLVGLPDISNIGATDAVYVNGINARSVIGITLTSVVGGDYFTFGLPGSVLVAVWYKVDGAGTAPSVPGATLVEIDILSGQTMQDIHLKTVNSINGQQVSRITANAAAAILNSSFFNFSTQTQSYYAWIDKGGTGTDPKIPGKIGVRILIESSDTKDMVTAKIATSLNERFFATPDLRGLFLKGVSAGSTFDIGAAKRMSINSIEVGDVIGSLEYSDNISHTHTATIETGSTSPGSSALSVVDNTTGPDSSLVSIGYDGSSESRPENIYVYYVIKY